MNKLSLKQKLILFFLIVAIVPSTLISGTNFYHSQNSRQQSAERDNREAMSQVMEYIDQKMRQVDDFSYWLCSNSTIQNLMLLPEDELTDCREQKKEVIEQLRLQLSYRPISEYILGLYIIGNNGLDLRHGSEASLVSYSTLASLSQRFSSNYWSGIMNNIASVSNNKNILLYCHPVTSQHYHGTIGYVMISFSDTLILDELDYITGSHEAFALLYSNHGHVLGLSGCDNNTIKVLNIFNTFPKNNGYQLLQITDASTHFVLKGLFSDAATLEQIRSLAFSSFLLTLFAVGITLFLAVFLSANLNRPIQCIRKNIAHISAARFADVERINGANDLVDLNNTILKMSCDIENLLEEQKQRENEKLILEMKVLSSQINPHFLYNTLNSIRIMAQMQGLNNIRTMIEALGRLLKANQAVSDEWIPLRNELELLDNYIYIQNVHFKGKIDYAWSVSDDDLLNQLVLKFSFQPLVENSIIHGISMKPQGGSIRIICDEHHSDLRIRIMDNGPGLAPERLAQIQQQLISNVTEKVEKSRSHIGIRNVSRRIQIRCGEHYGINIDNLDEGGVCTTILLPLQRKEL